MDISKGQVAAVAIIIAVLAQGLGGFLANADTVTSCESRFDYLTDVYGSFKGTGQDIPVDFNPRENVTGYYAYDPTDEEQSKQIKNLPAIIYDPAKNANQYPYPGQPVLRQQYEITIECLKAQDDPDSTEHYRVILNERTESGDVPIQVDDWYGPAETRQSGLYHESLGYIINSRITVQGQVHQAPRMLNLSDLCNHISVFAGTDLTLTSSAASPYPCFLANLSVNEDKSVFHDTFNLEYNSERAPYAYCNQSRGTTEIHASNYPIQASWLIFGSEAEGDNKITLDVITTMPDPKSKWIDPSTGVSPSHQSSSYVYFYDNYYFPTKLNGDMARDTRIHLDTSIGQERDVHYKFAVRVSTIDGDDPTKETAVFHDAAYVQIDANNDHITSSSTFKLINPADPDNPIILQDQHLATTNVSFNIVWEIDHNVMHIELSCEGKTVSGDFVFDWLSKSFTSYKWETLENESGSFNYIRIDSVISDSFENPAFDEEVTYLGYTEGTQPSAAIEHTYYPEHNSRDIPYSSEATYWNNGYGNPDPSMGSGNGNSLIGMVLETRPLRDGRGRALPTETPFNICMHYEDPLNPGQYINSWLYNDPLKKGISIWTDLDTRMVYIGHYNAEGIRQDGTAMQIGVCDHVYVELRVDKGNLSVWAAPIYQFTSFLEYKASPLMDQTASVQGILPVDHPQYKSMAQLSYNVQPVGIGPYSMGAPVQTWTSGGCTVTLDDQGNLTVTKTDGGDGRMDNYAPSAPQTAPWRAYYRDISRVIVMDGVTHIGNFAFYGLSDAGGIRIQATVTSIGTGAFAGCWSAKQIEFLQEEWAVTDIGDRAFALGTSEHPVTCTVFSPGSNAQGRLNAYGGEFTTFAYADNYEYPIYPRQLVVKTIILLDGGGQYIQDGVFHPNFDYPNSPLAELVINAVVHPGGTVTLGTTDDGGNMTTLLTMENDGVDKWISFKKGDGTPLWEGQKFDWWDVHIFYVSNKIGEVEIEGEYYGPQMYLPDGTKLAQNHVYVQAGKYGDVEDVGAMVNDEHGMSDLTVKMGGVWAFSTQFSNGTNIQGSHVEWGGSSWSWDMNSTLVVFALTMLMASIVLFYRYGYNIYDILLLGGSLAILWVSFTG